MGNLGQKLHGAVTATLREICSLRESHVLHALQGGIIFPGDVDMALKGRSDLPYTDEQKDCLSEEMPTQEVLAAGIESGHIWLPGPPRILTFRGVFDVSRELFQRGDFGPLWECLDFPDGDQCCITWYAIKAAPSGIDLSWDEQVQLMGPRTYVPCVTEVAWAMVVCSLVNKLRQPHVSRLPVEEVWARTSTIQSGRHVAIGFSGGKIRAFPVRDEKRFPNVGLAEALMKTWR